MLIVSQNKEKVLWFGMAFNALEYSEDIKRSGKKEEVRHTICISDGCLEEVAEYKTKERCLEVLKEFCSMYKSEYTAEFFDYTARTNGPGIYRNNIVYEFPAE